MVERINWDNTGAVTKACEVLKKGGVLVYPTDTLYGFGCDAKNEQAIHTINTIKNRSGPMSVIAPSKDAVETWLKLPGSGKMDVLKKLGGYWIGSVGKTYDKNKILGTTHSSRYTKKRRWLFQHFWLGIVAG